MKLNASRTRLLLGALVAVALALMAVGAAGAQAKLVKVTGIQHRGARPTARSSSWRTQA